MSNPSVTKRQKEKNRQDRQREKEAARRDRQVNKGDRPVTANGEDPDIAGIIPGPQPILED